MTSDKRGAKYYLPIVILASGFFCVLFSTFDLGFIDVYNFSDLGHQLYNYEMTLRGEVPLRDFWENWAPATFYLNAFAFKVFGVSIFSAKLLLAIFIAVSATTLFCISEKVMPRPVALVVALVSLLWGNFTVNLPYSGWFSNCFGLLALLWFIKYLGASRGKYFWLAATGLALGLTFSFKQHIGVLNLVAVAIATAVSVQIMEDRGSETEPADAKSSRFFRSLIILFDIALLLPGYVVFPLLFLKQLHASYRALDAKAFVVFLVPVFVVNSLILASLFNTSAYRNKKGDFRKLFRALLKRESALAAGFAVAVVPWFVYFSSLMGWRKFYRIISVTDPMQQGFKRSYAFSIPLQPLESGAVVFYLALCLLCALVIFLFAISRSRKTLYVTSTVTVGALIIIYRLALPIDPNGGSMFYLPLLLELFLLFALLKKPGGNLFSFGDSKEVFAVLTLAIFNIYNFLSLYIFADRVHYQMNIFPWLVLLGYAFYLVYSRAWRILVSPQFATRWRRAGILVAAALPFLVPYVGRALIIFHLQYTANVEYCEKFSRETGKRCESLLRKIEGDKGGVYVNSAFLAQIEEVVQYIRVNTDADDFLFGAPSTGMFNFLADRKFQSRYRYIWPQFMMKEQQMELAKDLSEKKPPFIIYNSAPRADLDAGGFFRLMPPVGEYISSNYKFDRKVGPFYLFKRRTLGSDD